MAVVIRMKITFPDECRHHPGAPIFHDAYKGWSCCNKKSVDFTEFLNIKGCTLAKHSNVVCVYCSFHSLALIKYLCRKHYTQLNPKLFDWLIQNRSMLVSPYNYLLELFFSIDKWFIYLFSNICICNWN